MTMHKQYKAIAVVDIIEGRVLRQSLELVSLAEDLLHGDLSGLLLFASGKEITAECTALSQKLGIDIEIVEHDGFIYPNPSLLSSVLAEVAEDHNPEYICFTHTIGNCSAAAGLSVKMKSQCITGVESLLKNSGRIFFRRSFFNGKLKEQVETSLPRKVITVMPGAFLFDEERCTLDREAEVIIREELQGMKGVSPISITKEKDTGSSLDDADVIISAGRGIGKPENLQLIRDMAGVFDNPAIGASRPVCDNKWLPYKHQVGVTGKTVSPKLYVALGISGSQQHIAGMKNSQCVVAVNTDPHAAIFSVADYVIVDDLTRFIPAFLEAERKRRRGE